MNSNARFPLKIQELIENKLPQTLSDLSKVAQRLNTAGIILIDEKPYTNFTSEDVLNILKGSSEKFANIDNWQRVFAEAICVTIYCEIKEVDVSSVLKNINLINEDDIFKFIKNKYTEISRKDGNALKPPMDEMSLLQLEREIEVQKQKLNDLKNKANDLSKNGEQIQNIRNYIAILEKRKLIIKLRDIVDNEYWFKERIGFITSKKIPDIIYQCRLILNDTYLTDDEIISELKNLSKEKPVNSDDFGNFVNNNITSFEKLLDEFVRYLEPQSALSQVELDDSFRVINAVIKSEVHDIKTQIDLSNLDLLKKIVDDKTIWVNKGNTNKKIHDKDPNDFTPQCVMEYRKILSNNRISQTNKIKKIIKISQKNIDHASSKVGEFNKHVNALFKDSNAYRQEAEGYLGEMNDKRMVAEKFRNDLDKTSHLYDVIEKLIMDDKWKDKGIDWFSKKIPEGIGKCREILESPCLNQWEKLEAVFMIGKIKLEETRDLRHSFFRLSRHDEVAELYNCIAHYSRIWHSLEPQKLVNPEKIFDLHKPKLKM